MDADSGEPNVVENEAALSVSIHPGVLLSISAHYTKAKVQSGQDNPRIIGAFVGKQEGRVVEVFMSYEGIFEEVEGNVIVDTAFLKEREEQLKQVIQYANYDFLGWYTTGSSPGTQELQIQRQLIEANENPLFLLVDTAAVQSSKSSGKVSRDLPIFLFESLFRIVDKEPQLQFSRANFTIATRESERISVDQVARADAGGQSAMATQLGSLAGAIRMLNDRLKLLQRFVDATEKGEVEPDYAALRRIHSLITQLPAADTSEFRQDLATEYSDALLTTYLASLTKGASVLSDTIDKFNLSNDNARGGGRKGGMGMGMHEMH